MVAPMNTSSSHSGRNNNKKMNHGYKPGDMSHLANFAEHVDWMTVRILCHVGLKSLPILTQCHSPAEIFSYFSKDEEDEKNRGNNSTTRHHNADQQHAAVQEDQENANTNAILYPLPTSCEYCGASSTKDCSPSSCNRPSSFFRKQRPPFVASGGDWDTKTGSPRSQQTFQVPSPLVEGGKKKNWMTKIGWKG
eukprot:scaffold3211_cov120-Cylindrotheca_fusiformis.AAC.5